MAESLRLRRIALDIIISAGKSVPVKGNCMGRAMPGGARVRLASCTVADLRAGDIVALERGGALYLHRLLRAVARADGVWLLTKGDASRRPDPLSPAESLVGRLIEVHINGHSHTYSPSAGDRVWAAFAGMLWWAVLAVKRAWRAESLPP